MIVRENVSLAPYTTFKIGGPARYFIEVASADEVCDAIKFAENKRLKLFVLGAGSNVLVPDEGISSVVLSLRGRVIDCSGERIVADAGASWDSIVDAAVEIGLFGIENLALIPGSVGGAVVQNIGAYGAELSPSVEYVDVIDIKTCEQIRISGEHAKFAYRTSLFKDSKDLIITRVGLRLSATGQLSLSYPDLAKARADGVSLTTPAEVANAVRRIREGKFPQTDTAGTAGSFFKNPIITADKADELVRKYPGLPLFHQEDKNVKIPLAWLLDHVLSMKGYKVGGARLYEKQPLVIVAEKGATASDVKKLADEITALVRNEIGVEIEREVEYIGDIN